MRLDGQAAARAQHREFFRGLLCRLRIGQADFGRLEQRGKHRGIGALAQSANDGFGKDVGTCNFLERFAGQGRPAATRMEFGILQRQAQQVFLEFVVVLEVALFLAVLGLVQGRLRDVDMAAFHQIRHLPVEKREQQRADMRAVDIRVRHDDDSMVAQLFRLEVVLADAGPKRRDQRGDFLRRDELVETRSFHVQDLAFQRQDRLELAVAALFGRTARRIALHQV